MGKAVSAVASPLTTQLSSVGGTGMDLLFGKKDPGRPGGYAPLSEEQKNLMGKYNQLANQDAGLLASNMANQQENQIRQNVADQQMRAQQMVAQRGLGNSSVGLNAILGQTGNMANQIGAVRANQPLLARQLNMENLNTATSGIQNILGSRMYDPGVSSGRKGGLAPILGMAAGAAFAPPGMQAQGAQMGGGMGQALQGAFTNA